MARHRRGGNRKHEFLSKAQWRWAYATGQPFAKRWSEKNETIGRHYKTLPKYKGVKGKAKGAVPGHKLATRARTRTHHVRKGFRRVG